jgi:hypothetical protein
MLLCILFFPSFPFFLPLSAASFDHLPPSPLLLFPSFSSFYFSSPLPPSSLVPSSLSFFFFSSRSSPGSHPSILSYIPPPPSYPSCLPTMSQCSPLLSIPSICPFPAVLLFLSPSHPSLSFSPPKSILPPLFLSFHPPIPSPL